MLKPIALVPPAVFLFILPFTHTVALRLTALALSGLIALWLWFRTPNRQRLPLKLPIALWACVAALSLAVAVNTAYSLREIENEIGYTMVAFFAFFTLTRGRRELTVWLSAIALGAAVMAALALGAWLYHGTWHAAGYQGGVGTFSTYVILVLPFVLLFGGYSGRRTLRALTTVLAAALLVAAYCTLNRAFWPAFTVEVAVLAILLFLRLVAAGRYRTGIAVVGAALVLVGIGGNAFVEVVQAKYRQVSSVSQLVGALRRDVRLPFWQSTLEAVEDKVWLGAGFGRHSFAEAHPKLRKNGNLWHAHNVFLNYWVQMGMPGLAALILLLGAIMRQFWRTYRIDRPDLVMLGAAGLTMIAGFVIKNLTDDFFINEISLLFWSLVGMSLGYRMNTAKTQAASEAEALSRRLEANGSADELPSGTPVPVSNVASNAEAPACGPSSSPLDRTEAASGRFK